MIGVTFIARTSRTMYNLNVMVMVDCIKIMIGATFIDRSIRMLAVRKLCITHRECVVTVMVVTLFDLVSIDLSF